MIIAAVAQVKDGEGDLTETERVRRELELLGLRSQEIKLAPLRVGWREPLPPGYWRGAASPIRAMIEAQRLVDSGALDAYILSGEDFIRTEFKGRPEERARHMVAYPSGDTFLSGYTTLGHEFLRTWAISEATFFLLRDAVFENCWRTWSRLHPESPPPRAEWLSPVSALYRGVDCANPSVDFEGCMILMSEKAAGACGIPLANQVRVLGAAIEIAGPDELSSIPAIVRYEHLRTALNQVAATTGVDLAAALRGGRCALEVYTCFPVVPLAFLLRSGLAHTVDEVAELLSWLELTVTGGLNLAKAPWNNTTLSACVEMVRLIRTGSHPVGLVHSNSALGYQQAVALFAPARG